MLLASRIPCDGYVSNAHEMSPLATFATPKPSRTHRTSTSASIYSACRALHSFLNTSEPLAPSQQERSVQHFLKAPIQFVDRQTLQMSSGRVRSRKYAQSTPKTTSGSVPPSRKRRRSALDSRDCIDGSEDKENAERDTSSDPAPPSTPKPNKRRCPPTLPLGLGREDFISLQSPSTPAPPPRRDIAVLPHTPFQIQPDFNFLTPSQPLPLIAVPPSTTDYTPATKHTNASYSPSLYPHCERQEQHQHHLQPPSGSRANSEDLDSPLRHLILSKFRPGRNQDCWTDSNSSPASQLSTFATSQGHQRHDNLRYGVGAPVEGFRRGTGPWKRGGLEDLKFL